VGLSQKGTRGLREVLELCGPEDCTLARDPSWHRGGITLQIMFHCFYSGIQCFDSWFEGSGHVV